MQPLTEQQKNFFDTFGYLKFPGLFKEDIGKVTADFEAVFQQKQIQHDETKRTMIGLFADQSAELCALLDDPRILAIASGLLGEEFNYIGSDGNYYSGDTPWHPDGRHSKYMNQNKLNYPRWRLLRNYSELRTFNDADGLT